VIRRIGWQPTRRDERLAGASLTSIGTASSTDDKTAIAVACFGADICSLGLSIRAASSPVP
jgi:hypothetical protein